MIVCNLIIKLFEKAQVIAPCERECSIALLLSNLLKIADAFSCPTYILHVSFVLHVQVAFEAFPHIQPSRGIGHQVIRPAKHFEFARSPLCLQKV